MKSDTVRSLFSLALAVVAATAFGNLALAQEFKPAPPPPVLEKLDEGAPPSITIQDKEDKPRQNSITQTRSQGAVDDVTVNSGPSTYHLRPRTVGNSVPGDIPSAPRTNPEWVIKTFDLGSGKGARSVSTPSSQGNTPAAVNPAP
jgi:hypothetical protein